MDQKAKQRSFTIKYKHMTTRTLQESRAASLCPQRFVEVKERHGKNAQWGGQIVTYYNGIGWLTKEEVALWDAKKTPGGVYSSHKHFVPAPEVEGMKGSLWPGEQRGRISVVRTSGKWVPEEKERKVSPQ